jgi:WD40 repeat protein
MLNYGGSEDGNVYVWNASDGTQFLQLPGHHGIVTSVAWSPDGTWLASGGSGREGGELFVWEVQCGDCVREREAHQETVQALKLSPDGSFLASCGNDGAITLRRDRPYERLDITGIRGLTEAQKATLHGLGALEEAGSSSASTEQVGS